MSKLLILIASLLFVALVTSNTTPAKWRYCIVPGNCTAFYPCGAPDLREAQPCPGNLVFNETAQACDYAENVPGVCQVPTTPPTPPPTTPPPPTTTPPPTTMN